MSKPTSRQCHECKYEWSAESYWKDGEVWICDDCITILGLSPSPWRGSPPWRGVYPINRGPRQ